MGNALLLMVVRFSRGKKSTLSRDAELAATEQRLVALQTEILTLAERDARSFAPVAAAYQMSNATPAEKAVRVRAIDQGLMGAMDVPRETLRLAQAALAAVLPVADCAGKSIVSDLAAGAELLRAAAEIAYLNLRVNVALLSESAGARDALAAAGQMHEAIGEHQAALRAAADRLIG